MIGGAIATAGVLFLVLSATAGVYNGLAAAGLGLAVCNWLAPFITGVESSLSSGMR